MKRSNFTFLFLFALLSFVSVNLGAQAGPQSSSCINEVNITVDAMCGFSVDKDVLGYTGAIMPQSIVYAGPTTNSGTMFPGTGSITAAGQPGTSGLNIPNGGTVQYQLWSQPDGLGTMLCWGDINFEIKMTPEMETSTQTYMCGQPLPPLPSYMAGPCQAEITNITGSVQTEGNVCDGLETIRTITGVTSLHGVKQTITLRIDTFIQTPLDTGMVECPMGGPDFTDALKLDCDKLGDVYPTPEEVYDYYYNWYVYEALEHIDVAKAHATAKAYPYVVKDPITKMIPQDPICVDRTVPVQKPVIIDGIEYWITVDSHYVVCTPQPDIEKVIPVYVPLPKGTTCNLSVKCTDMQFPGCTGPDSKVMRTWQILDWCNGSIKECMQWIVVEPADPYFHEVMGYDRDVFDILPTATFDGITKPKIYAEIAPWTCAAQIQLDAWVDWSCIADGSIHWTSTTGTIGSDNVLRGLWLGEPAMVTATALGCHSLENPVTVSFWVVPYNNIYPVPIAEDEVNVTLTHDNTGTVSPDGGVAKVFVDAIDAGSHNAGCGEVDVCLLLKEELLNPVYDNDGNHMTVGGHYIYHAAQCTPDGHIPGTPASKNNPGTPDIYYVYCKDYVKFCCSDIGQNQVALVATNSGGHSAHSWSYVNVEDKSQAQYYCTPYAKLTCDDDYNPYAYAPTFSSAICEASNVTKTIIEDIDVCGNGYHIITWYLDGEAICDTYVEFEAESEFDPYEIKWPKHYTGEYEDGVRRECEGGYFVEYPVPTPQEPGVAMGPAFDCAEGGDTGEPVWCEAACSLVGSTYEPLEVEAADACKKIIKRWTVIDWCYWDPNTTNPDDDNDTAYDTFQAVDDEWLGAGEWYTSVVGDGAEGEYCDECDKTNAASDHVYFRYLSVDPDGYYTFDQVIKVIDEDAPEVDADPTVYISITDGAAYKYDDFDDCYAGEFIPASVTDMCGDEDLATDGAAWWIEVYYSNAYGSRYGLINSASKFGTDVEMFSGYGYPGDYHLIVWSVRDGCGNIGEAETLVHFKDDKAPTPVCIQDLSTAIMPTTGSVTIWANDYDNGSFDNCKEVGVYFLLDENGYPTDASDTTAYFSSSLTVTCQMIADIGQGEVIVLGLYAAERHYYYNDDDEYVYYTGLYDFCNITLDVNGATEVCDLGEAASALIAGAISTELGDMVESAEVALNVGAKDITGLEGTYVFNGNAVSQSYEIKATKDDDYMNGVTTLDLVLTQKHVLGLDQLDSPYKVIAADVNADGVVSARDLSEMRKAILGQTARFPNNNSWRFVDAKQTFDNPLSPFPFLEVISISNLSENMLEEDFIAVKIGDVNGNAYANSALRGDARTAGRLALQVEETTATAGELVEVVVGASNFDAISAYQFTMELNGLEFVSATSGAIEVNEYNFGLIDANTVTTAWTTSEGVSTSESLFTMTFRATADVSLSEALTISSRVTESMAYTTTQDRLDVSLEYNTVGSNGFVLLQNQPNPFDEVTYIGFELPVAGTAVFTVFDVTGKTISVTTDSYGAGYNEITLRKSDLGTTGVMYYQLESGDFTATKKMILIE